MSYFVNPVEEDQCLFLSDEGEMQAPELSVAWREANGMLDQRHWRRMVIDVTQLRSVLTRKELFNLARELSCKGCRRLRVALVIRPQQERHAHLFEKIVRNAGVFLTYFLDPERASAWVKRTGLAGHGGKTRESRKPLAAPATIVTETEVASAGLSMGRGPFQLPHHAAAV